MSFNVDQTNIIAYDQLWLSHHRLSKSNAEIYFSLSAFCLPMDVKDKVGPFKDGFDYFLVEEFSNDHIFFIGKWIKNIERSS